MARWLAPDMYPLSAQIRFVCVQATEAWSRLTGRGHVDTPEVDSLSSAQTLLEATITRLRGERSEGAAPGEDTMVVLDLRPELVLEMTLAEYVRSWSTPQFYFHLNIAYAILRHSGVDLGKADYVPHVLAFVRK